MNIGETNILKLLRITAPGAYLADEDEQEVLLPGKYLNGNENIGDELEVFLYNDSEDRPVATTEKPKITLNNIAPLEVVAVSKFGVFLDWGLEKDLLVPFKEQIVKMQVGEKHVVRLYLDEETDRLAATARIRKYLPNDPVTVQEGEEVSLLVFHISKLGYEVVINQKHTGLVFMNEVFSELHTGDSLQGYIKKIRSDHKIDVSVRPPARQHAESSVQVVLDALHANAGHLDMNDKSSPELIYKKLQMSKKTFKQAIGQLYKQRKILIESHGISLVEKAT